MLEKGIAYKRTGVVNWDPVDQTVLANEQVIDGRGWRTGAVVEKREIPMYYLAHHAVRGGAARRPRQAARLARAREADAGELDRPQRGRATSASRYEIDGERKLLRVFTTRADTIMGVTFVAIAAEHPLATRLARDNPKLAAFVEECKRGSVDGGRPRDDGEEGHADRLLRHASAHRREGRRSGSATTC